MHEEHTGSRTEGEHERLAEELRSLLPALAARAEELLLTLSRVEHPTRPAGGEFATDESAFDQSAAGDSAAGDSAAGDSARGTVGCPFCTLTAVLREANAKRPAGGLHEWLLLLLTSLRQAFTAPGRETGSNEGTAPSRETGATDAVHRHGTGEAAERPTDEPRVRPITVNRVRGDVLGGKSARGRDSAS
ncbi:hypothetical protein SAMN04487819_10764 [Actinopolyspora alba]|uniref:Uncharacterized protein n=1 Tax=Actinopolyspora alba TaxID=673379 RepID=A0A1I1XEY8_9ACTN|nr:hypothetical protein [Actinopolyspora alba]SFE05208.1 hypothetical protein SAMN04487819_10764 [Actinopolyspora alba]